MSRVTAAPNVSNAPMVHDIEARQNEALQLLDELEARIAKVLSEFGGTPVAPTAAIRPPVESLAPADSVPV
jgi:hypothetical protein